MPLHQRSFDAYTASAVFEVGDGLVTEQEIIEFARRYDPRAVDVDTAAAVMVVMREQLIAVALAKGSRDMDNVCWLRLVRQEALDRNGEVVMTEEGRAMVRGRP